MWSVQWYIFYDVNKCLLILNMFSLIDIFAPICQRIKQWLFIIKEKKKRRFDTKQTSCFHFVLSPPHHRSHAIYNTGMKKEKITKGENKGITASNYHKNSINKD